jgi:hypothetical protein
MLERLYKLFVFSTSDSIWTLAFWRLRAETASAMLGVK